MQSRLTIAGLHVAVVASFAIAQPVFDVLSQNPTFLAVRRTDLSELLAFVIILMLLPPALLLLVEWIAIRISSRLHGLVHSFILWMLFGLIALRALRGLGGTPGAVIVAAAGLMALAAAYAYRHFDPARMVVTFATPALLVFPGLFAFSPAVYKAVAPQGALPALASVGPTGIPIVFLVFDELPVTALMDERGELDVARYPSFTRLARTATWFRNATGVGFDTTHAVPPILTGNYPVRGTLPTASDHPVNLFTLLGPSYTLNVLENVTHLCPDALCSRVAPPSLSARLGSLTADALAVYLHVIVPPAFAARLPAIDQQWKDFWGPPVLPAWHASQVVNSLLGDRVSQFREFISSIRPDEANALHFIHALLPHVPYVYLPSGKIYDREGRLDGLRAEQWDPDGSYSTAGYQRYLLQLAFLDRLIGELLDHLEEVRLYDRCLLVITADHGVSFRPGDSRRILTATNYQDIMPVPLFIKVPQQRRGEIVDRNVELVDVLPSIAEVLGARLPEPVDGRSVWDASPERTTKVVFGRRLKRLRFDARIDAKYATLRWKMELYGKEGTGSMLFRGEPHARLIGLSLDEVPRGKAADMEIQLDQAEDLEEVDLPSPFVPARLTGTVTMGSEIPEPFSLAIAVNGRIEATTSVFGIQARSARFATMIPETSLRDGRNDVLVLRIATDSTGRVAFQPPVSAANLRYGLASKEAGKGEVLIGPEGAEIPLVSGALRGFLDEASRRSHGVLVRGWAASPERSEIAARVVIFADGRFVYAGLPNARRPDVAHAFADPGLEASGFTYLLPPGSVAEARSVLLRVFAVAQTGVASELVYADGANELKARK